MLLPTCNIGLNCKAHSVVFFSMNTKSELSVHGHDAGGPEVPQVVAVLGHGRRAAACHKAHTTDLHLW